MHHLHRRDLALGEGVPRARSVAHQVDEHVHALIVDDARRLVGLGLGLGLGLEIGLGLGLRAASASESSEMSTKVRVSAARARRSAEPAWRRSEESEAKAHRCSRGERPSAWNLSGLG